MPPDSIQVFGLASREWQRQCVRGGRCEPFKLYWKATSNDQELKIYDVNSEYPAAQIYGYAPFGQMTIELVYDQAKPFLLVMKELARKAPTVDMMAIFKDPTGQHGGGLIECIIESGYSPFPILPFKVKTKSYTKNMFMVRHGVWQGFISVLAEAIVHSQVIVTHIKHIQVWGTTSNQLFKDFLAPIYGAKVEASGWSKNLQASIFTEEAKEDYVLISNSRGIPVHLDKVKDNPGMRTTAKTEANCGWGYLCQKPHANEIMYFDNEDEGEVEAMGDLLLGLETETDSRRLMNIPTAIGQYTRLKTTKAPMDMLDKEMNANIAYHVGGCAPAWGLQLLSRTLLTLHPNQPVYCDTDSIFFVYDKTKIEAKIYKDIPTGLFLGDFVDEYPDWRIVEFVCIGPKSYFYKLVHRRTGEVMYKGRFKGLPFLSSCYSLLNENDELAKFGMEEMKDILFGSLQQTDEEKKEDPMEELTLKFRYTNYFKRNQDLKIRKVEEKKTIRFTFDKRKVVLPDDRSKIRELSEINTMPLQEETEWYPQAVDDWWDEQKRKIDLLDK